MLNFFKKKKTKHNSEFSRFFHEASSAERKKVFLKAARKATKDQEKIMEMSS